MNNARAQIEDKAHSHTVHLGGNRKRRVEKFKAKRTLVDISYNSMSEVINSLIDIALDKEKC